MKKLFTILLLAFSITVSAQTFVQKYFGGSYIVKKGEDPYLSQLAFIKLIHEPSKFLVTIYLSTQESNFNEQIVYYLHVKEKVELEGEDAVVQLNFEYSDSGIKNAAFYYHEEEDKWIILLEKNDYLIADSFLKLQP